MAKELSFRDLLQMDNRQVAEVFWQGHAINAEELHLTKYLGVDLSLPAWVNRILWKTFRKTFYGDPATGVTRGWNVKLEQTGWDSPTVPKRNSKGEELAFGHYHLCNTGSRKFPKNWKGAQCLDYGIAGNSPFDPAAYTCSPLVAVNRGSVDLLLGWEIFKIGNTYIPIEDYWVLKYDGKLETIQQPPKTH